MTGIPGRLRRFGVVPAALCAAAGCGGGDAPPEERIDGQRAYALRCGYCHNVPNGIGAALTPKVLAGYGTVGALDRYLRVAMPHEAPGSLSGAEYDAILQHLLDSRNLLPDGADHGNPPDSTRLQEPGRTPPG